MKISTALAGVLIGMLLLAACAPATIPEPTSPPEPPPPPAAPELPALTPMSVDELTDITWQWTGQLEQDPPFQASVPNPENYTLTFRTDGTYAMQADCNVGGGAYTIDGAVLSILPGPMTLAYCGEQSSSEVFLLLLSQIGTFASENGDLHLVTQDGNTHMVFANAGPAAALEPIPAAGSTDPAVFLGEPSGEDDFVNASNWTLFDNQCFTTRIQGGRFSMIANGVEAFPCWEVSWPMIEDFYIETLAFTPEVCDPQDRYGLFVRAPDTTRGYLYGIDCSGSYSLNLFDGERTTQLVAPTVSDAINRGEGTTNRLGIAVSGEDFYLYANGAYLTQVQDPTFVEPGRIGYFVRAASEEPFTSAYDYLKVWVLQDDFYPPVAGAEPPAGEEIPLDPPEAGDLSATANVNLNVRAGPGMLFKVIGHVLKGQTGEILGSSPDGFWYAFSIPPEGLQAGRMSYDTGWVSANFATLDNPSGDPLPIVIPPLLPQLVYVDQPAPGAPQLTTQQPATVRTGPKLTFPILGVTSVGATAEVLARSEDGEWWQIRLPTWFTSDGFGWVNRDFVRTQNVSNVRVIRDSSLPSVPRDVRPSASGAGNPAARALETIRVHSRPTTDSPSLGRVDAGTVMAISGRSEDGRWWAINLPTTIASDGRGWVQAAYVVATKTSNVPIVR